jgi:tRNA isopentenyl-2-thiomethyl-A-37 hydroxylase MiaE
MRNRKKLINIITNNLLCKLTTDQLDDLEYMIKKYVVTNSTIDDLSKLTKCELKKTDLNKYMVATIATRSHKRISKLNSKKGD